MIDSWTCHVCGENRPDRFVSVHKRDISEKYNLPAGTFMENIRYCNDDESCIEGAKTHSHFTKESAQEKVKENSTKVDEHFKSIKKVGEKKEKYNAMRYFYTFLIVFAAAMIINPFLSSLLHEGATYLGKMFDPFSIFLRLILATYLSWRFTDKLFPKK